MKNIKIIALVIVFTAVTSFVGYSYAGSTVVTTKGTFKCDNACVVAEDGSVTDNGGGNVWKLIKPDVPEAPKET